MSTDSSSSDCNRRMTATILRLQVLPLDRFADLVTESEQAGHRFLRRLLEEWDSGVNRFDRPGEALFIASVDDQVLGVCGLNIDPYILQPRVGRVRHLYVSSVHRRRGIGRRLVRELILFARGVFDRLRLRAENEIAAQFYEASGFRRCPGEPDCTHVLELRRLSLPGDS